jgi:hypothetical protein
MMQEVSHTLFQFGLSWMLTVGRAFALRKYVGIPSIHDWTLNAARWYQPIFSYNSRLWPLTGLQLLLPSEYVFRLCVQADASLLNPTFPERECNLGAYRYSLNGLQRDVNLYVYRQDVSLYTLS